ncbi:MAG: flippase-like domain-containing protein [Bacteroidales bacterium]|nr:flippase-like domain-containing protein [Bacteroidales bacterium]
MKKRIFSVIQYLFFLLIGIVLLWLVFRKIDINEVFHEIREARYIWLLGSIILGIFSHIARAIRWNILIRSMGYQVETSTTFFAVMVGYLANMAFPRLGEVTRCGVLSKKKNIPFTSLFGTVISERVFDMIVLALIILSVIFLQLGLLKAFVDKYIVSSLTGMANQENLYLLLVAIFIIIILPLIFIRIFFNRIRQMKVYSRVSDFMKGLLNGIKTIMHMREKWQFIGWTIVIWLFYTLMTYSAFFALEATSHLDFFDGVTVMALGSLGIVAPVPGGIGAYQFVVKAILTEIYLIQSEPAVSFSIILWAAQSIMIVGVGIFSYYLLVFKKAKKNNDNT